MSEPDYYIDKSLVPTLERQGPLLREVYFSSATEAMNAALGADTLGLGWRIDSYDVWETGKEETYVREYRLTVWSKVWACWYGSMIDRSRTKETS